MEAERGIHNNQEKEEGVGTVLLGCSIAKVADYSGCNSQEESAVDVLAAAAVVAGQQKSTPFGGANTADIGLSRVLLLAAEIAMVGEGAAAAVETRSIGRMIRAVQH